VVFPDIDFPSVPRQALAPERDRDYMTSPEMMGTQIELLWRKERVKPL